MALVISNAKAVLVQIFRDRYLIDGVKTELEMPSCIVINAECAMLYVHDVTAFSFVVGKQVEFAHFHRCNITCIDARDVAPRNVVITESEIELTKTRAKERGVQNLLDLGDDEDYSFVPKIHRSRCFPA